MTNRFNEPLNELRGFSEIGMANEALSVAKGILRKKSIELRDFCEAVDVILIHADHLKPWRARVERAYGRLNEDGKRLSATKILNFYVSIGAWKEAYDFIPRK